ncbi:fibronectin/fibrinogen-binding protein [Butyrivibrio sp. CB08]|uniref:Rqc2 family fibronectin-binding protein n=1 Tax=Butyrivibrio sp. CB08 TaxID=2364879 RepID=UPI000EA9CC28|nr:NFACT RNA binding domain-containing protein [Butyrivibrio sp. CB08]RKM57596.1 fibronectin/fibrinogen-binding protein [Butyrivibrio sp. CB08]
MAFDGITVANLKRDFENLLVGGRIYKIAQTESDELFITVKLSYEAAEKYGIKQTRLVLSSDASLPLVYLTDESKASPMTAPNFCMLLRKHIQNGRITSVTQPGGLERILRFEVEHLDEMGDLRHKVLLIEIMGKYSNIIFTDEDDVIIDSIKHIPASVSSVREVLPGRTYFIPSQDKANPLETTADEFSSLVLGKPMPVFKAIYSSYTGLSPIIAQEICYRALVDADKPANALSTSESISVYRAFDVIMQHVREGSFVPAIYYEAGAPKEYSSIPLSIYGFDLRGAADAESATSSDENISVMTDISALIEQYYSEKNVVTRIKQKSVDLRKIVQTTLERNVRKYDLQLKQMADCDKKDKYRVYGELLNTYGYSASEGDKSITVNDYNTGKDITIPLDPTLSARENAGKYFDKYTKLKRTAEALEEQMKEVAETIEQLESIATSLDIAKKEADLAQIRQELAESGYIKSHATGKNGRKEKITSKPFHYQSSDGFDIYVGKNNIQNDELTFKTANGGDWWFHAKKIPGSHVVLLTGGREVPDRAFEEAAALAAYYSKGKVQEKVEIDYLKRKDVKKPNGAKPGFVVYYTNYSMAIAPDISKLKLISD